MFYVLLLRVRLYRISRCRPRGRDIRSPPRHYGTVVVPSNRARCRNTDLNLSLKDRLETVIDCACTGVASFKD